MSIDITPYALFGFTVAGVLCLVFVVSCILSVTKAVRDRRQIKARNEAKRAAQASGNGHAPGGRANKKPRPNILIIHDGEREDRIKGGTTGFNSSGSSPRPPGSGISSPGEQNSRHTETTTLAEVACHHSSLSSSPGVAGELGERVEAEVMINGHHLPPGQANAKHHNAHSSSKRRSVDIEGKAVSYRRTSSSSACSPTESGIVTTFPVSDCARDGTHDSITDLHRDGSRDKKSRRNGSGGTVNGRIKSHGRDEIYHAGHAASDGNISHKKNIRSDTSPHVSGSSSFHGFTKGRNATKTSSSTHYAVELAERRKEYVCARYNPRRNSYAAAIANPDWVDLPPLRRHSDDPRQVRFHSSTSQIYQKHGDNMRMRHHSSEGADNPAYEAAEDIGDQV
ncbi:hypothetical protein V1264_018243 [Littorina saxatilis]